MISLHMHQIKNLEIREGDCWIELTATCQNGTSQEITFFMAHGDESERKQQKLEVLEGLRDSLNELLEQY
jgi:hypothetical protein